MQDISSPLSPTFEQDQQTAKPGKQLKGPPQHKEQDTYLLTCSENAEAEHPQGNPRLSRASGKILEHFPTPS